MAVSMRHSPVHGVMGQLCAEPYFLLVLPPEAGGSWQSSKPFVYLILGSWITRNVLDMNLGMFFFHGKGNYGKWYLSRQRTIRGLAWCHQGHILLVIRPLGDFFIGMFHPLEPRRCEFEALSPC